MVQIDVQSRIQRLMKRTDDALAADASRLRGRLRAARARARRGQPVDRMLAQVEQQLAASCDIVAMRREAMPAVRYPDDLPVAARREDIMAAIAEHRVVVVCGATGSGKTTQLPKMCLELGRGLRGVIGHTQPRRLAARAVAARLAEELNRPLGQFVGYKVRFADQTDRRTAIKVMTDGMLLAELAGDRSLSQYDTLIIDEAHERSLNIDFLLGCLRQLLERRRDLKVIITSATIDPQRFAEHFEPANGKPVPIIDVQGRTYPVEVRYRPLEREGDEQDRDPIQGIAEALVELGREDRGDVLVFLPGERDIRDAAEAIAKDTRIDAQVLPLYARLPAAAQQKIFHPKGGRRVILATNVAETSLTVPRIRHVIDTGVARISRYAARSKVQRLPIEPISRASADQRKGRCGRLAPGICVRLYDEKDFDERPQFTEPEIQRTNLASVILQTESLKLGDPRQFPFIDPPVSRMIRDGYDTLFELGAIDEQQRLTQIGRDLSRMPVDPRIGRMILAGRDEQALREVLVIAAALSIQDPRVRPADRQQAADEAHAQWFDGESDFLGYLSLWRWYRNLRDKASGGGTRRACAQHCLAYTRMREWEDLHRQLRDAAADQRMHLNENPAAPDAIHRALLTGLLSNVGYREQGFEYTGAHGRKFAIFPGSSLFDVKPRWIMAAELIETSKLYAHIVAPIQPDWIERLAPHLVQSHHSQVRWNRDSGKVLADERATLFGLTIVARRTVNFGPIEPRAARDLFIHHGLVEAELDTAAPFFTHNARLIEQIERLEAKQRKKDILADPRTRFDFYHERLPAAVYDLATLDAWRKRAEQDDPKRLFMTEALLLAGATDHITPQLYPDALRTGAAKLDLDYVAEPGHESDGVTVRVPLGLLSTVDPQQLDWLVPGLLRDKVEALMRALPKAYRRQFVPIPDFVGRLVPWLEEHRDRPLLVALSECIGRHTGVSIPPQAWRTDGLEQHLKMNIAVTDQKGRVVAGGRDLQTLRVQLGQKTADVIRHAASGAWQRDGVRAWDFGELPDTVTVDSRGMAVHGYPAIVDQGQAVALRVMDTADGAAAATRRGLRRLFALQVASELAFIEAELEDVAAAAMKIAPLCDRRTLVDDLLDAAVDATFIEGQPPVRNDGQFDRRLLDRGAQLQSLAERLWQIVRQTIDAYHQARLAIDESPDAWRELKADVREQLGHLLVARWISGTPWAWLHQMPRYVRGIARRIEKARDGAIGKDTQRLGQLRPYWRAWLAAADPSPRPADAELGRYRWMLEEFRVSLFAQDLGTAIKVSPRRLDEQAAKAGLVVGR